jgi:hypothetical protein
VMDPNGVVTRDIHTFNPDNIDDWARWWLFLFGPPYAYSSDGDWSALGTWDDGETWDSVSDSWDGVEVWTEAGITWDDGGTWDTTLTIAQVEDLRIVPKNFDNAHTTGTVVVLNADLELWDYPEGTWDEAGNWSDYGPLTLSV